MRDSAKPRSAAIDRDSWSTKRFLSTLTGRIRFTYWRRLHTFSADAVILLAGVHVGLNWRWVVSAVSQLARLGARTAQHDRALP